MSRMINLQRCFKIPKAKLDIFLVALYVNFSNTNLSCEAEYVFQNENDYDVVVNFYGLVTGFVDPIEEFVAKL